MGWVAIEGYKFPYRISDTGRVQSFASGKWVDMNPSMYRKLTVTFRTTDNKSKTVPVKRLVVDAFMGGRKAGYRVIHKNGMKTDCAVENLAFVREEALGKMFGGVGKRKVVLKVDKNGDLLDVYSSSKEAAKKSFMSERQIERHCRGQVQNPFKYMDYTFCYDK